MSDESARRGLPVRCRCGWRSRRVIGPNLGWPCPQCDGDVEYGYWLKAPGEEPHRRAWRSAR